jgi:hypothetical protein
LEPIKPDRGQGPIVTVKVLGEIPFFSGMCTEIIHFNFSRFPVFPLTLNFDSSHLKFWQKLAETKLTGTFKDIFIYLTLDNCK